jgi:hypothetical protein
MSFGCTRECVGDYIIGHERRQQISSRVHSIGIGFGANAGQDYIGEGASRRGSNPRASARASVLPRLVASLFFT